MNCQGDETVAPSYVRAEVSSNGDPRWTTWPDSLWYNWRMSKFRWRTRSPVPPDFWSAFPELTPVVCQLLYHRGIRTQAAIDEFLHPDYGQDLHNPFDFTPMEAVVDRIMASVEQRERVLVYGDYDADGVCAAALLADSLRALGLTPGIYLPFRETEGYGLNAGAVAEILQQGYRLVITVDCGITNVEEAAQLGAAGVDVIITDHHNPPDQVPRAFALLNPKLPGEHYPYHHLSGAGLAFKVVQALLSNRTRSRFRSVRFPPDGFEKWLLDLVAISTVADMSELVGENRTLVRYGLTVLRKTRRLGLRALLAVAGVAPEAADTSTIGFALAPRLNAAGRMNHASTAYQLLVSNDEEEVRRLADELDDQNRQRQRLTESIRRAARDQLAAVERAPLLFCVGETWPVGLVGLVAGRLMDEYARPAVVIGRNANGALVGSGRSVTGFNITAALEECRSHLSRFGGHPAACGFTVRSADDLQPLQQRLEQLAAASLGDVPQPATLDVDAELDLAHATFRLASELEQLEPFGPGHPRPRLLSRQLRVVSVLPVGSSGQHLRLMVSQHGHPEVVKLIGFSLGTKPPTVGAGDVIDVVFELEVREWNGNRELQLKIIDLEKVG